MIDYLLPPQSERHQCCRDDWFYYIYKWLTATKEREREITRESFDDYCRDDKSVNPARFEPRLWRRLVPNLHDFFDWAIFTRCRSRVVLTLSHSLSLSRARSRESVVPLQTFYSPVFIFYRNNRRQIVEKKGSHLKCTILRVRGEKCRVYMLSFACVFVFMRVSMCASRQHQTLLLQQLIEIAKKTSRKWGILFPQLIDAEKKTER